VTANQYDDAPEGVGEPIDPAVRARIVELTKFDKKRSGTDWADDTSRRIGTCIPLTVEQRSQVRTFLAQNTPVNGQPPGGAGVPNGTPGHRQPLAELALDRDGLDCLPEPEPLIAETIDRRTVAVIAGHYGTCKSFLAQAWTGSITTGRPWMGRPVDTDGGRVLYVAAEGAHGLNQRFAAWEYAWNQRKRIPRERLTVIPRPVNLMRADDVAELCAMAVGVDLVIVDTLARCMVGADENSARDIGLVVDALYRVRDATGDGSVLGLHHTGKDRATIRGSSALEDGVDTVYLSEGDVRNLTVKRTKRKDGPTDDELQFQLNPVDGTSSAVLSRLVENVRITDSETKILSHIRSHYATIPFTRAELVKTSEVSQATVYRAVTTLVDLGKLAGVGRGNAIKFQLVDDD
jgi:AAA domain